MFVLKSTCHRTSCCGLIHAGHPTGSFPCLRCGLKKRMGHAPSLPLWPPLPLPEGAAAGPKQSQLLTMTGLGDFCSSPTPPRTLREETQKYYSVFVSF